MVPGDPAVQQQASPAVIEVSESVADAQDFLDQQVDGFGLHHHRADRVVLAGHPSNPLLHFAGQ
jgi:hypothetical protein